MNHVPVVIASPGDLPARFPGARFVARTTLPFVHVGSAEWLDLEADLLAFDRRVHEAEDAGEFALAVDDATVGASILLRYQRLIPCSNAASASVHFRRVWQVFRDLHDLRKPLVRADWDHANDVWQWVLRLEPYAGLEVQLAGLLHDVERLDSEAYVRMEHTAGDYDAYKDAHARAGAARARAILDACDVACASEVADLVAEHERKSPDPRRTLLGDADALSFFGVNCAGYLAYFGPDQTRKKVAWTLRRMSRRAMRHLVGLRLPPGIVAAMDGALPRIRRFEARDSP